MSTNSLPDFDRSLALARGNLDAAALAECHGVACGLLVRQHEANADEFFSLLAMLEIVRDATPGLQSTLEELFATSRVQLGDDEFQLALWLPADEESLEDRTEALAQWCNGFLASIGAGDDQQRLETLSGEAAEALADLQEIALAEIGADGEPDESDPEEEEGAFAEIVEYIRVAVLILREDLRGPEAGDSIH